MTKKRRYKDVVACLQICTTLTNKHIFLIIYYLQEIQKKCAMICVHRYSITDVKSKIKIKVRAAVNRLASSLILP